MLLISIHSLVISSFTKGRIHNFSTSVFSSSQSLSTQLQRYLLSSLICFLRAITQCLIKGILTSLSQVYGVSIIPSFPTVLGLYVFFVFSVNINWATSYPRVIVDDFHLPHGKPQLLNPGPQPTSLVSPHHHLSSSHAQGLVAYRTCSCATHSVSWQNLT